MNEKIYSPFDKKSHETDIICKNAIVEIKSGHKFKCLKQMIAQKAAAERRKMKSILYAPHIPFNAKRVFEQNGIIVVKNVDQLYEEVKKKDENY